MNALSTLLLSLSLSADAFAVATSKGAALRHPPWREVVRTGLVFGTVEALTPLLGWALGAFTSRYVEAIDHWIAFVILGGLGIKMILESFSDEEPDIKPQRHKLRALLLAALGTSIDAMGVGVTLAFIDANIWLTSLAIGLTTFLMASLGLTIGHSVGSRFGKRAERLGGLTLIAIGTGILLEHVGVA